MKIATDVAIAFMFFLYGARLATANVIAGVAHWRLHALVLASTFVLFPAVGLVLFHCLPQWLVPGPLALGMLYLCLLPSTIQSSLAFTSIAGGNVPAAMCSATLSSLIGARGDAVARRDVRVDARRRADRRRDPRDRAFSWLRR